MTETPSIPRRAQFLGLDSRLAHPLAESLVRCNCHAVPAGQGADIVFCSPSADIVRQARAKYAGLPVVVVSESPDQRRWLDALEAGASDYCTAPFEPMHLRWLLDRHVQRRRASAAA